MERTSWRACVSKTVALPCALALLATIPSRAQTPPAVQDLLMRVGERVAEFYRRAQNVIAIETSTVQAIELDSSPQGFARTVESELHVEADNGDAAAGPIVIRTIRKVNGRMPRDKDKKDRAACTDPNPLSTEPLAFLLHAHRGEYRFTVAGSSKVRDRPAVRIDFASIDRRSTPQLIEDPAGHDDCFDWTGHIPSKGRVWVDAANYDVLLMERSITGPVDVTVPTLIQRRHHLESWITIVRDDERIRYKSIAFSDPDEVLLLPESIDSTTMIRGGLQSMRRTQTFSDYRRFITAGRVLH